MTTDQLKAAREAAEALLKATLEIVDSDGGYCEQTRLSEIVCRYVLSVPVDGREEARGRTGNYWRNQ